jgi:hypothetical protein
VAGDIKALFDKWYERSGQVAPVRIPKLGRARLMQHLGEHGLTRGAEVGVDRGYFSECMIKNIPDLELMAVDIWHWKFRGETCYNSTMGRLGDVPAFMRCGLCGAVVETTRYMSKPRCAACEAHEWEDPPLTHRSLVSARQAVAKAGTMVLRMDSLEAARLVEDESLDFVYIDGDHRFDAVMADLIVWSRKVRFGGVVSGHDYYRFRHAGVVPAVDAYTRQHGVERWFLTDQKMATFFWVRQPSFVDAPYTR